MSSNNNKRVSFKKQDESDTMYYQKNPNQQKYVRKDQQHSQQGKYKRKQSEEDQQQVNNNRQNYKPKKQEQQDDGQRFNTNRQNYRKRNDNQDRQQNNAQNDQNDRKNSNQQNYQRKDNQNAQYRQKNNNQQQYQQRKNQDQQYSDSEDEYYSDHDDNYQSRRNQNNNQNRRQQGGRQQQRRRERKVDYKFKAHLNQKQAEKGVEDKTLYKGVFLANENSRQYGQIRCDDFELKIFVNNKEDQNRALHGQTVIFRLKNEEELKVVEEKRQERREKYEYQRDQKEVKQHFKDTGSKVLYKRRDDENEEFKRVEKKLDHQVGEIVYLEPYEVNTKQLVGFLRESIQDDNLDKDIEKNEEEQKNNNNNKKNNNNGKKPPLAYWFNPLNKKLPKMYVKNITDPTLYKLSKEELESSYFTGKIIQWNRDTFHPDLELNTKVGQLGDIETECQALLKENQINENDFSENTQEYIDRVIKPQLDENGEFIIPKEEREKRWDLTKEIICTIDPETARDLDDALSIKKIGDNEFEIGVHIADVSHFVVEGSPLEEEARLRTTSVYLVHRVIPMLPRILCENLCSLNPNVERMAFSIFFKMDTEGNILYEKGIKYGKSIIKSCAKMSYETAQKIINGTFKSLQEVPDELLPSKEVNHNQWFDNIKNMNVIAQNRRKKRYDNGAISLVERLKKYFILDEDHWPVKYNIVERFEAHMMIEEYMIIANELAARKVTEVDRELGVIRKHNSPTQDKIEAFQKFLDQFENVKINLDFSSGLALRESIDKMNLNEPKYDENILKIINHQLVKLLETAEYALTSSTNKSTWYHYALALEVYTHFTSPIRRYPDILSHRLLFKALQYGENLKEQVNTKEITDILEFCNQMKTNSKRVSDGCEKIFMCLYLKKNTVNTTGIVSGMGDRSARILIPEYDIDKQIVFQDYKSISNVTVKENQQGVKQAVIQYNTKDGHDQQQKGEYKLNMYQTVNVQLTSTKRFPVDYKLHLKIQDQNEKDNAFLLL